MDQVLNTLKYRPYIDGLRAIAVLGVVLYHVYPDLVPGGFAGVDIFFVISGFLITTIIVQNLKNGVFSFVDFYSSRIRRIFPALIVVLIAAILAGYFLLLPSEFKSLGKHVLASSLFSSNFLLWTENGYFDVQSHEKPLLHLWSLGVEEQFYLLSPLLLWGAYKLKINLRALLFSLLAMSFAVGLYLIQTDSVGAFYLPQGRFWEIICGGILALQTSEKSQRNNPDSPIFSFLVSLTGIGLILYSFKFLSDQTRFPGFWALIPVAGCMLILYANDDTSFKQKILGQRTMVWIGKISYPLYLWHWIFFCFFAIGFSAPLHEKYRFAILPLSFVFSWATYRWIELPLKRNSANYKKITVLLITGLLALGALGAATIYDGVIQSSKKYTDIATRRDEKIDFDKLSKGLRSWSYLTDDLCKNNIDSAPITFCVIDKMPPQVMLLGDSHANQLYPGLIKYFGNKIGILSVGNGPPLDGVQIHVGRKAMAWNSNLTSLERSYAILEKFPSIRTVVIASMWGPLIRGDFLLDELRNNFGSVTMSSSFSNESAIDRQKMVEISLSRLISKLFAQGRSVILVIDTPEPEFDVVVCIRNQEPALNCSFKASKVQDRQLQFRQIAGNLQKSFPKLQIFDPLPIVCPSGRCYGYDQDFLTFRDNNHISEATSDKIGVSLGPAIRQTLKSW